MERITVTPLDQRIECRTECGACCIAISITSPIPGMPQGKPAGIRCLHLLDDYRCAIFHDPSRPRVCHDFQANRDVCGDNQAQALQLIEQLEVATR